MKRYLKQSKSRYRKSQQETNDCTVIAFSIACRTTYKEAHEKLRVAGRKKGKGFSVQRSMDMFPMFRFTKLDNSNRTAAKIKSFRQKNGSKFTPKTIGDKLKRGYYICVTCDHAFAVVNGDVEDWSNNRNLHIWEVYKVERKRA